MTTRTISVDDLLCEIDEHLSEVDTPYLAALAEKVCGGPYEPLSDGEHIRHRGTALVFTTVIEDILHSMRNMETAELAMLASTLLTDLYEARDDERVIVTLIERAVGEK